MIYKFNLVSIDPTTIASSIRGTYSGVPAWVVAPPKSFI